MPRTSRSNSDGVTKRLAVGRTTGKDWVRTRHKPAIVSPLIEVPSVLDLQDYLGDLSAHPVSVHVVHDYAQRTLTTDEFCDVLNKSPSRGTLDIDNARSVLSDIKDRITGTRMLKTLGTETSPVPIGELHRPQVQGCKSTFSVTYTSESDVSATVTVFGVGGGTTVSRQYTWGDSTDASGKCLRLVLPTTVRYEMWERRNGTTFTKGVITNVAEDYQAIPLPASEDQCGLPIVKARGFPGLKWDFGSIPADTTQTKPVSEKQGVTITASIQPTIAGVTIGPKVSVQFSRELKYSFLLAGPRDYVGYSPSGWPQVCWAWSP